MMRAFFTTALNILMPRKVFNLERDVRQSNWIITKIQKQEIYAQNFYAALCNNAYAPEDVWGILSNIKWDCTWRYAAGLIADIREDESYIDWYCSGTGFQGIDFTGFVEESYVTEEVETDINSIGWVLIQRRFIDI
jgi:hypothetical protein